MNEMKHSRTNCGCTGGCTNCIQENEMLDAKLNEMDKNLPKPLLGELLYQLGMQAQSHKGTQDNGMGAFNSEDLERAVKKNLKLKEEIIKLLNNI